MLRLFFRFVYTIAAMVFSAASAHSQTTRDVLVRGRVLDARDSVPLFAVVISRERIATHLYALTDSSGRFTFRAPIEDRYVRIRFDNGFYISESVEAAVDSSNVIDLDAVLLKRGPEPIEYMIIPTCTAVDRVPKPLPQGMWVQRDSRAKARQKPVVCDGLLREPRVQRNPLPTPPNTR